MRSTTATRMALLVSCLLVGSSAVAEQESGASLGLLHWMSGSWGAVIDGVRMEEHWTTPAAGMMIGMHRDVFPSGKGFFEFLRLEEGPDGPVYLAAPMGREPTPFHMVEIGHQRAVFANPEHDFPDRITYRMNGNDTLCARAEGLQDGERSSREWCWNRLSPAAPGDGSAAEVESLE